jgi:hypothetical protein
MEKDIQSFMNDKIVVITTKDYQKTTVPLFCPICDFPMKTSDDSVSYRKNLCCFKCENRWLNNLTKKLQNPDKESEIWKEYIEERALLSRTIFNFS